MFHFELCIWTVPHSCFSVIMCEVIKLWIILYEDHNELLNQTTLILKTIFSSQYICLIRWLLERIVPPYVLFYLCVCACVCSLLGSQERFLSARRCSPARPPAAGDRWALLHPNLNPTNQTAPTSRIPSHPWLYQPDQQGAACFFISLVWLKFTAVRCHGYTKDINTNRSWHKTHKP